VDNDAMAAAQEPRGTTVTSAGELPPVLDRVGEGLLGAAMAMAVCAVLLTLFATAPAFRPGGRGAAAVVPRPRLAAPLVTITGGAVVAFVAYLAYDGRCREWCGPTASGREVWWRIQDAWQWGAQLTLASVGLGAAALALVLAARGMRGVRPAVRVAQIAFAVWFVVSLAIPLGIEIAMSG
jgi:hypothetical protein